MAKILIGTSSWSEHRDLYPSGTKTSEQLSVYARAFPIVEINTSYYHIPAVSTVAKWAERTPDGFMFDAKPPRELTATPEVPSGQAPEPDADTAREFEASLRPLADAGKLGAVTFQFPPSYRNIERHRDYLRLLPELFPDYPLSVEFRRRDWLDEEHAETTLALLRETGMSFTMVDEPQVGMGTVPPVYGITNRSLAIIRFHGRNAANWYNFTDQSAHRFEWNYQTEDLAFWAERIMTAAKAVEEVHVFFNNNVDGHGIRNARTLMTLLDIPFEQEPEQTRLPLDGA
ncbi:DUF72 domain-containing protein [soil metagenome]